MASPMLLDRVKQKIIDSQRENCCLITACSYNELGQKFIYLRDLRVRARAREQESKGARVLSVSVDS